jgi:predicted MFS family arabinose efflux permease
MKAKTLTATPGIMIPALTGFIALLIGNGFGRFGYPPLIPALIKEHWFSVSQADYLGAANLTGYIIGAAFGTRINRYVPSLYLIRISLFTAALSFACCAYPLAFPVYFSLRLIAGLAGGIVMVLTAPTIFKHTPTEKKGLLSGIIFSGVGVGIALAGSLIPVLVQISLTTTWLSFAVISLVFMLISWNGWPAGSNEKHTVEIPVTRAGNHSTWNRSIVLLLISYACNAVGFVPHTVFWVDFVSRGLHMGIERGTQLWVLLGISAALGPLISGYMADGIGFGKSIRISLLIKGIGVMMPIFSTAWWSLVLSSVFVGSLALGISSLAAGRITELVIPGLQKKVWSRMTITFSITHALTAYGMSYLFSVYGSYYLLFKIGAATLIIGCVLDFISSRR